jgi:hypothetical protein
MKKTFILVGLLLIGATVFGQDVSVTTDNGLDRGWWFFNKKDWDAHYKDWNTAKNVDVMHTLNGLLEQIVTSDLKIISEKFDYVLDYAVLEIPCDYIFGGEALVKVFVKKGKIVKVFFKVKNF